MTPRIREKNFFNASMFCGLCSLALGVWLGHKYITGIPPFVPDTAYFILWIAVVSTGSAFFLVCGAVMAALDVFFRSAKKCHYCKKTVFNFRRRLIVSWPEPSKYSNEEVELRAVMHSACHDESAEKFKIPNPEFSDISF